MGTAASCSKARPPCPSEPILIPKLRIQFADFPYLHYSIDQRLLTLETCCGYGYELVRLRRNLPGIFKVPLGTRGCCENCSTLRQYQNPFSLREDSRALAAYAEKTTLPRAPEGVSQSCRVATTDRGPKQFRYQVLEYGPDSLSAVQRYCF